MTEKPIVDLDALSFVDSSVLTLRHPKGVELGNITVASPSHPQVLAYEEERRKRSVAELQEYQTAAAEALKEGRKVPPTPEETRTVDDIRKRNAQDLAAFVLDADVRFKHGGKVYDLNRTTAEAIFSDPALPWIYGQVRRHVDATENFIPTSAGA